MTYEIYNCNCNDAVQLEETTQATNAMFRISKSLIKNKCAINFERKSDPPNSM